MRSWGKQLIRLQFKSRLNYVEIISENAANQSTLKKKKKKKTGLVQVHHVNF